MDDTDCAQIPLGASPSWLQQLDNSLWLEYNQTVLTAALQIAQVMEVCALLSFPLRAVIFAVHSAELMEILLACSFFSLSHLIRGGMVLLL